MKFVRSLLFILTIFSISYTVHSTPMFSLVHTDWNVEPSEIILDVNNPSSYELNLEPGQAKEVTIKPFDLNLELDQAKENTIRLFYMDENKEISNLITFTGESKSSFGTDAIIKNGSFCLNYWNSSRTEHTYDIATCYREHFKFSVKNYLDTKQTIIIKIAAQNRLSQKKTMINLLARTKGN